MSFCSITYPFIQFERIGIIIKQEIQIFQLFSQKPTVQIGQLIGKKNLKGENKIYIPWYIIELLSRPIDSTNSRITRSPKCMFLDSLLTTISPFYISLSPPHDEILTLPSHHCPSKKKSENEKGENLLTSGLISEGISLSHLGIISLSEPLSGPDSPIPCGYITLSTSPTPILLPHPIQRLLFLIIFHLIRS